MASFGFRAIKKRNIKVPYIHEWNTHGI